MCCSKSWKNCVIPSPKILQDISLWNGGPNSGPREIREAWTNRNQRNLHVKKSLNYLHSLGGLISVIALQEDWHCSMLGQQENESSLALTQLSSEPEAVTSHRAFSLQPGTFLNGSHVLHAPLGSSGTF